MRGLFRFAVAALALLASDAGAQSAGPPRSCHWTQGCNDSIFKVSAAIYQESTAAAYTPMSAFDLAVSPAQVIEADCRFITAAVAATTGIQIQVTGPASPTFLRINRLYPNAATLANSVSDRSAFDSAATDDGVTASQGAIFAPTFITILLVNGVNAGTLKFALESEIGGSNVAVYEGSFCSYRNL